LFPAISDLLPSFFTRLASDFQGMGF